MIRSIDVILFAAKHGLVIRTDLTRQALQGVDREALETDAATHWTAQVWDGQGDPPVGERARWDHDQDAIGRATQEAFASGKVVYFLMRDGKLHHYQPYVAYERGWTALETDTNHPYHWQKAVDAHIAKEVEQEVDQQVLYAALEAALALHEAQGIPVGVTSHVEGAR